MPRELTTQKQVHGCAVATGDPRVALIRIGYTGLEGESDLAGCNLFVRWFAKADFAEDFLKIL